MTNKFNQETEISVQQTQDSVERKQRHKPMHRYPMFMDQKN